MTRPALFGLAWALLPLAAPAPAAAQGVLVAPHAVYLDHRTRSGSITLYNPGTEPAEVTIGTLFGYPVTDSVGRLQLATFESDSGQPSATGWIQAFPRRVTVPPQQRQTVRLLARPPQGLPDGEYWTRLVVSAKGGAVPVTGVPDSAGIQVGLTLEVRTILSLAYRKGPVTTALSLSDLAAEVVGDSLSVVAHLTRGGNAAFVGTARGWLIDAAGTERGHFELPLAVYYDIRPRFRLGIAGLPAGSYTLRFEVTAQRDDIAPESVLPAAPVRDSVRVRLP